MMQDFERVTNHLPNAVTADHAWMLYGLIRWLRPHTAVEIGSFHGYTAAWIARALLDNGYGVLYCVDNFTLQDASAKNLHRNLEDVGVSKVIQILQGDSDKVTLPEKVDFAFIDGDHTLEGCREDVLNIMFRGARCIVVHDTTNWWGASEWVTEFRENDYTAYHDYDLIEVTHSEGLTILMQRPINKPSPGWTRDGSPSGSA